MKYFHRLLEGALSSRVSRQKIRLLLGARQTGKSTLLAHLVPKQATVIDLQDSERRLEFERRPRAFTELLLGKGGARHTVVIDEIQRVPALLDEVQWLFDRYGKRFEFFLTGSSARKLRASSSNLLPGRSHVHHIYPILQTERGVKSQILPVPAKLSAPLFPTRGLNDLLLYGSLPGIILEKPESACRSLQGYAELYLEEEIRREGLVRDVGAFSRFLELAALESGKTMNLAKLSNQSGVPVTTLRLYYQVLVDTFVGYWLEPFTKSGRKRLLTTPKFFLFDLGVRNAAARLDPTENLLRLQGGELLEHWVGLELIHRVRTLGPGYRVGFWRTVGGAEIDFVLETPKEVIPIEVKWTDKPSVYDAQHLERFIRDVPESKRGFVVCRTREPRRLADRIQAVNWESL